jgi:hypothetical protein
MLNNYSQRLSLITFLLLSVFSLAAQNSLNPTFNNSNVYTGIEVGSKGVKMSVIEIGKNAQANGAFNILKDTSVNTDFISFTESTFQATLKGLCSLFNTAEVEYKIPSKNIFTVISSGVKMQAEKDTKLAWINNLIDSFRVNIKEPNRKIEVIDVKEEGRLSHLGIVPDSRRYATFLIDIGSGNTKGGFFPFGNTKDFKLFQLNWGTKSTTNATNKNCGDDQTLDNYKKQLLRVLAGAENSEIIYAVNSSGAYPVSDNVAISGGIAWAVATLSHPEKVDENIIPISYAELVKFSDKLYKNFDAFSPSFLTGNINLPDEKQAAFKQVTTVHKVFDQKAMMAGVGLLLKIMRQFESAFGGKEFFLIKNGQVGWVSAYVDQSIER